MNEPMTNAENQEHNKQIVDKYNAKPNIIEIRKNNPPREVIRIAPDGKLFWNEREVETDDDFRSAMLDLAESLKQPTDLIRQQQAEIIKLKLEWQYMYDRANMESANEPVAWMDYLEHSDVYDLNVSGRGIPLYTHPVKDNFEEGYRAGYKFCANLYEANPVKELTDEEINEVIKIEASKDPAGIGWNLAFNVARAILRKAQEK